MREAIVGFMFVTAVLLFAVFALFSGGLDQVGETMHPLETTFPNVAGLEVDDAVSLAGVRIGQVAQIKVEGEQVRVRMLVESGQPVKTDSIARLETESLLGGRRIDISLGSPGAGPVSAGSVIPGEVSVDMDELVENVGDMSRDIRALVNDLQANQADVFGRLGETVEEARAAFAIVNRILGENEVALTSAVESLGSMGPRLETTLGRLDSITEQIQSGEGTLGKLVYDPALYNEMLDLGHSLNVSAEKLAEALDTHGDDIGQAMSALAEAGPQIEATMTRLNRLTERIESGEGTLGKLMTDETLYVEATRAMQAVGDAAENAREQGPISTFTGAVVGAASAFN